MDALREQFDAVATWVSQQVGRPLATMLAGLVIVLWAFSGPFFGFSDTWQLVINTGTTIVTFLMVFLIQSTQNRETKAIHLKLDEILRAVPEASNEMILHHLEESSAADLQRVQEQIEERVRDQGSGETS